MNCQSIDDSEIAYPDELIIIGGARGVGKTTIAKEVSKQLSGSYVHPGDKFIKYFYSGLNIRETKIIEGMALNEVLNSPKPTIVDLHYKFYSKSNGWGDGFCDDSLTILAQNYSKIKLYLVELDAGTLYQRRLADPNKEKKKRKIEKEVIQEELRQNKEGFQRFVDFLGKLTRVESKVVVNNDFQKSLEEIVGS